MKKNNVQDWIPIKEICNDGIIKLRNNNYIKLIKVNPINYNLKSDLEKKSILNSYKIFLKTCNFNIEILIQSKREDLEKHINNIRKNTNIKENFVAVSYIAITSSHKKRLNIINYIQSFIIIPPLL